MNASEVTLAVVVAPLVIVWAIVVVDIVRTQRSGRSRVWWLVACTLVWPAIILYWMTRPVPGRAVAARRRTDARAQLVAAALAHEAGRIDDAELAREVAALRQS